MLLGSQVSLQWVVLEHVFDLPLRFQMRAVTHRLLGMICGLLDRGRDRLVELCRVPEALGQSVYLEKVLMVPGRLPVTLGPFSPGHIGQLLPKYLL